MKWWVTGLEPVNSGAGVLQRKLETRLTQMGDEIVGTGPEDTGAWTGAGYAVSHAPKLLSLKARRLAANPELSRAQCSLLLSTPYPARLFHPSILLVLDLRWRRTRGIVGRTYREVELRRAVDSADSVFAISARTIGDLRAWLPSLGGRGTVLSLGPGLFDAPDLREGEPGTVLLVGNATHKRNELAAAALARARPSWAQRFVCLNTSRSVIQILTGSFGAASVTELRRVSEQAVRAAYHRSSVFILLSTDEGFGFPYLEALSAGCVVIAIRQPLTQDLLADAGVLIKDGPVEALADQLRELPAWPTADDRAAVAARYSWERCASQIQAEGHALLGLSRGA